MQTRTSEGWIDEPIPRMWIETHFPEKISPFFLFDGERMDEFFRRAEALHVQDAVRKIAQLEPLERLTTHLEQVRTDARNEATREDPEEALIEAKRVLDEAIELQEQMRQSRRELLEGQQALRGTLDDLRQRRTGLPDSEAFAEASQLESELGEARGQIREAEKSFYSWVGEIAPFVFGHSAVIALLDRIAEAERNEIMPPPVQGEKLKELLHDHQCICAREIREDSPAWNTIVELVKKSEEVAPEAEVLSYLEPPAHMAARSFSDYLQEWNDRSGQIREFRDREELLNKQLGELRDRLRHHDEEKVRKLQEDWDTCVAELEDVAARIARIDTDLETQKRLVTDAERDYERLLDCKGTRHIHRARYKFITECRNAAIATYQALDGETRDRVATAMAQNFLDLLSERKSRTTYTGVDIDGSYRVRVKHAKTDKASGSLSQGERECLALAFSFALNEVTGFQLPFVIDTPLGRLDPEVRVKAVRKIIEQIPDRQLVILVQPSEYPEDVQAVLRTVPLEVFDLEFNSEQQLTEVRRAQ
ncbi:MAG: hypothetical protein IBX63_10190 [Coriobacteriia bacterium]|nr:hypothetical protein [Coriobacteriia bacterium]